MRTTRAAVFPALRAPVEVREFALPELEPGAALLRVECIEVCGTDVHLERGRIFLPIREFARSCTTSLQPTSISTEAATWARWARLPAVTMTT